jgi:hypothetical protein
LRLVAFRAATLVLGAAIFRAALAALRVTPAAVRFALAFADFSARSSWARSLVARREAFLISFEADALAAATLRPVCLRAFFIARVAAALAPAAAFETFRTAFFAVFCARAVAGRAGFLLAMAVSFRLLDSRR